MWGREAGPGGLAALVGPIQQWMAILSRLSRPADHCAPGHNSASTPARRVLPIPSADAGQDIGGQLVDGGVAGQPEAEVELSQHVGDDLPAALLAGQG